MSFRHALALAIAASLAAGAVQAQAPARPAVEAKPASKASADLAALFAASDEATLRRNPLNALFRGDMRYAGEVGGLYSDAYDAAETAAAEADLANLARIDRSALTASEQVSYDVFRWQRGMDLRGLGPDVLPVTRVLAIDHFNGIHLLFADLGGGEGSAPFKTVADYENGLKRLSGYAAVMDRINARLREGLARGVTQPRKIMANTLEQLDAMVASGVEGSVFYRPVANFPADIPPADQARLKAAYAKALREDLLPAIARTRDLLKTEYLPKARDTIGYGGLPGGPAAYRYLVELNTTLALDPEQVHQIGLSEVARIHGEMEKVKARLGFTGSLQDFFAAVRNDPKLRPASRQALTEGYQAIGRRVDPLLPRLFEQVPKARLDIRPVPELSEKGAAGGSYVQGAPDGSRPGVFYFNAYNLPARSTVGMTSLYLHEGAPGHHFQIMLAQENEALPAFQRFGGNGAYVEGWGLYAESLGPELGVLEDPYQYFGYLSAELGRSIRLVVDTGIHAKGWTREQALDYFAANSLFGPGSGGGELERYMSIPGQALGYKIGQLKIRELRTRAEEALGAKFDIRAFHQQVLGDGALPLPVLEAKIDRWIASRK